MKRILIALALGGAGTLLAPAVQAQTDTTRTTVKPQLNTAPPGALPRPAQPTPRPAVPVPAPTEAPLPAPTVKPTPNSPSGLEFPKGTSAADQPKEQYKLFLYGNVGLGYSSYNGIGQFSASIGPSIGYRITEKLAVGPGISYSYNNYSFAGAGNLKLNSLGLKFFAQYTVYQQFFVHAEYEATRAESFDLVSVNSTQVAIVPVTRNYRTPLAGIGYRSQLSDRFAADIVVLYNFNDGYSADGSPLSPYGQPVIRFNFLYNLRWKARL
ncbi:hypothetical protein GCM10022408_19410 [Hymenobacter fastidiosus]|uniref:Outer membrane protein beta-barrel domain-containing protein n=1 Tax=Hymenobacter fastidiosus TaxID=486264 RepID=A0ABP7S7R0_9BACT